MKVTIQNKDDLKNVTGELFQLKIKADKGAGDLFSMERKVYLVFFSNKVQINKSDVFTIQKESSDYQRISRLTETQKLKFILLDAQTKEQLDKAVVKQNKDRDLGRIALKIRKLLWQN